MHKISKNSILPIFLLFYKSLTLHTYKLCLTFFNFATNFLNYLKYRE